MSHLISGTNIEAPNLLDVPCRNILSPRFKNVFKNITRSSSSKYKWKEEKAITHLCKKLSDLEFQLMRTKNEKTITKHCEKLKRKLRAEIPQNSKKIHSIFESREQNNITEASLEELRKKMPINIDLERKYVFRFRTNALLYKQADQIDREKQNYRRWFTHEKNHLINSPNVKKMNFILEKIDMNTFHFRNKTINEWQGIKVHERKGYIGKYSKLKTQPTV